MDIQKAFGETLKDLRTQKHISQEQFALQIGMDRTYYASVEAGRRNISILNILKIAEGFDIPLSKLFQQQEESHPLPVLDTGFDPHLEINQVLSEKEVHDVFECQTTLGIRLSKKNNLFVIMSGSAKKKIYDDVWKDDTLYYNGTDINSDENANQTLEKGKGNNNAQLYEVWNTPDDVKPKIFLFTKHEANKCIYKGEVKLKEKPFLQTRHDDPTRKVWIFPLQLVNSKNC